MGTGNLILNAVSALCSAVGLAVFLYWLFDNVSQSYRSGLSVQRSRDTSGGDILAANLPLSAHLNRMVTAVLPLADDWSRQNVFGLAELVKRWDLALVRAGLRTRISPEQFLALNMMCAVLPTALFLILLLLFGASLPVAVFMALLMGALPGSVLPTMVLRGEAKNRTSSIEKRLPFAIEFMLLALEARAAFRGAIEIYCRQMGDDALADELRLTLGDVSAGLPVEDALLNMAKRIESDDVSTFALAVTTGIATGQPLREVLQVQADVARQRRFQSAEQVAKTAATRAIFPLFLVMIAILILLIGPLAIRISQNSLF